MRSYAEYSIGRDVKFRLVEAAARLVEGSATEEKLLAEAFGWLKKFWGGGQNQATAAPDGATLQPGEEAVPAVPMYDRQATSKFINNQNYANQITGALKKAIQNTSNELMQKFGASNPKVQAFFGQLPEKLGQVIDQQSKNWGVDNIGGERVKLNDPWMGSHPEVKAARRLAAGTGTPPPPRPPVANPSQLPPTGPPPLPIRRTGPPPLPPRTA